MFGLQDFCLCSASEFLAAEGREGKSLKLSEEGYYLFSGDKFVIVLNKRILKVYFVMGLQSGSEFPDIYTLVFSLSLPIFFFFDVSCQAIERLFC